MTMHETCNSNLIVLISYFLLLKPPSSLTPLLFLNLYTGSKLINVLSIRFFLLHIKFWVVLTIRGTIFSKLLYPSIRVRTAPPVSVRVRVRVSVSFTFTEIDYHGPAAPCCPSEAVQA